MSDNWAYNDLEKKFHQQAVKFLETHRKQLDKKPVKYVPMGFSYEREKMKKKQIIINK